MDLEQRGIYSLIAWVSIRSVQLQMIKFTLFSHYSEGYACETSSLHQYRRFKPVKHIDLTYS